MSDARELLASAAIRAGLAPEEQARVRGIETVEAIDSTNAELLRRPAPPAGHFDLLLAESQTAGRGRRGRSWIAPPGGAICLSIAWTYARTPEDLGSLSLAMGVCVRRALLQCGLLQLALKWPNDLQVQARKLGGILIELRSRHEGGAPSGVLGIGVNLALGAQALAAVAASGTEATDLQRCGIPDRSRARIAAAMASECVRGLTEFERSALGSFLNEWAEADALKGCEVSVSGAAGVRRGIARGIDVHGALLLETPDGIERILSGDVSVRRT